MDNDSADVAYVVWRIIPRPLADNHGSSLLHIHR